MFRSLVRSLLSRSKANAAAPKPVTFKPTLSALEVRDTPAALPLPVAGPVTHYPIGGDTYVSVGPLGLEFVKDCADFGLDAAGIDVRVGLGGPQGPSVHFVHEGPDGRVTSGIEFAGGAWAGVAALIGPSNEPEATPLYDPNDKGLMAVPPYIVFGAPGAGNLPPGF